jgi:nitrogen fixation/metabolism regulation signal transduction histidine kinase
VIDASHALFTRKEVTLEPLDLNEATREVIALSLSDLHRNRVVLRLELADELPTITGDRIQLQQVILNLLRNASEAMTGVDDRPRHLLVKTEREPGDGVRTTVRDAGVGLDSSNAITVVSGQSRMTAPVRRSRFPFPSRPKAARTRHPNPIPRYRSTRSFNRPVVARMV